MIVTQRELRRIVQEVVRRKLDDVGGPNVPVTAPVSVRLEGRLTQGQLQSIIDEEFALAMALRNPLDEDVDTEERQERLGRDLDGDNEEGESAAHRKAVLGHQEDDLDQMTSYLEGETS